MVKKLLDKSGANGSKNVLYHETWVNGVLKTGQELSSVVTAAGQDEVVAIGKNSDLGIGSGSFAIRLNILKSSVNMVVMPGFESIDLSIDIIDGAMLWLPILGSSKKGLYR